MRFLILSIFLFRIGVLLLQPFLGFLRELVRSKTEWTLIRLITYLQLVNFNANPLTSFSYLREVILGLNHNLILLKLQDNIFKLLRELVFHLRF